MMLSLKQLSCEQFSGVGKATLKRFNALNIHSVYDLLLHFPSTYQDRTVLIPIAKTPINRSVVVEGIVTKAQVHYGRRRSLVCTLADDSGEINLRFFHFSSMQQRYSLHEGARLRCFGEVRFHQAQKYIIHPEYETVKTDEVFQGEKTFTAVYPSKAGLSQTLWRSVIKQALVLLENSTEPDDVLEKVYQRFDLLPLKQALHLIHCPPNTEDLKTLFNQQHPAQKSLAFMELLSHHLTMRKQRVALQSNRSLALNATNQLTSDLQQQLPFVLTGAQQRAIKTIRQELACTQPMMRLLQGDVGSGKTLVALFALLQACEAACQGVLMAPTELLAQQHYQTLKTYCDPLGVSVFCLTGQLTAAIKREALTAIRAGEIDIVVGTHALFQKDVVCARLALVVIDEQHRFGVEQRLALLNKGKQEGLVPHQLVMTATPIPRTLAMTFYADLASSILDELPPGRTPVTTVALANTRRDEVTERIRARCSEGQQAYWVCTLVAESEALQCQAAETTAQQLQQLLPELNIGLVHGRTKAIDKDRNMQAFKQGKVDVLVATTVIEVGVDVPNASLMIIENPERLGLSQLHQLRGRVGRGSQRSHCVLLYQSPLSQLAHQRLAIVRDSHDGFVIAEKDLALRGPGDILGTRQAGLLQFRFADLIRDQHLLSKVQDAADFMLSQPECS